MTAPLLFRRNGFRIVSTAIAILACHIGSVAADPNSNILTGVASLVIPGAGQIANKDYDAAAAHFSIFAVSVYGALRYQKQSDYLDEDERYDDANDREFINRTTLKYDYAARLATDTALACVRC